MSGILPPRRGERPYFDQTCGRVSGSGRHCGLPAEQHICWTHDMDNSLVCAEHWAEAQTLWAFYDHHPLCEMCTNPDPSWVYSWDEPPGRCVWIVSDDTIAAVEHARELVGVS